MEIKEDHDIFVETRTLLNQFQRALLAIRQTQEFVATSHGNAITTEDRFVWEARKEFPDTPLDSLRSIAEYVHPKVHERMDLVAKLERESASNDERREAMAQWSDSLREGIVEITGDTEDFLKFDRIWGLTTESSTRERVLLNSLLITAVSEFETLVSGLVRLFLQARPEILRSSEKKFSYRELEEYSSMNEFLDATREGVADEVLRGGFDKWMVWLENERNLGIPEVTTKNPALSEVFQRRHLLVHNSGVVNTYYLDRVSGEKLPPEGIQLRASQNYLRNALDVMTIAGVKIGIAVARKVLKARECLDEVDHYLSHVTYDQMVDGRYRVAYEIGMLQGASARDAGTRLIGQVNAWLSLKNLSGVEKIAAEIEMWDVSTLESRFKLAKLALLDHEAEAYDLVKKLIDRGELEPSEWMNWPLLATIRSYEENSVPADKRIWTPAFDTPHTEN